MTSSGMKIQKMEVEQNSFYFSHILYSFALNAYEDTHR